MGDRLGVTASPSRLGGIYRHRCKGGEAELVSPPSARPGARARPSSECGTYNAWHEQTIEFIRPGPALDQKGFSEPWACTKKNGPRIVSCQAAREEGGSRGRLMRWHDFVRPALAKAVRARLSVLEPNAMQCEALRPAMRGEARVARPPSMIAW